VKIAKRDCPHNKYQSDENQVLTSPSMNGSDTMKSLLWCLYLCVLDTLASDEQLSGLSGDAPLLPRLASHRSAMYVACSASVYSSSTLGVAVPVNLRS
jgi:hypothetical protein